MRDHGSRCGRRSCGFAAVEGIVGVADSRQSGGVGVSRRTSCCSGPPLLLDSVARVVIGAAAEQSRSAAEGLRVATQQSPVPVRRKRVVVWVILLAVVGA